MAPKDTWSSIFAPWSERVVDIFEVDSALSVSETGQRAIWRDVESEAVAWNAVEFFNDFSRRSVETLGADVDVAAAREN